MRAEVAYLGWFSLRSVIREAIQKRDEIQRRIWFGKPVRRRRVDEQGRVRVWTEQIPLTKEERAEAEREHAEMSEWIDQCQSERRACAFIAGELIPEMDRASAGKPLGERAMLDIQPERRSRA